MPNLHHNIQRTTDNLMLLHRTLVVRQMLEREHQKIERMNSLERAVYRVYIKFCNGMYYANKTICEKFGYRVIDYPPRLVQNTISLALAIFLLIFVKKLKL
jgi:hypothetical protein